MLPKRTSGPLGAFNHVTLSANSVCLDKRIRAVGRVGVEPTTPGLKDVCMECCSIPVDTELEHFVRRLRPDLYLMCCPVVGGGEKFVNKLVNNSTASLIRSVNGP